MRTRGLTIIGGGLAGLSLGRSLLQHGIPVHLHEAGTYPRHKVCGEFISGMAASTMNELGLLPFLEQAQTLQTVRWYGRKKAWRDWRMPAPAFGISRFSLDQALAESFVAAGGELQTGSRYKLDPTQATGEGIIQTTGRIPSTRPSGPRWLGVKVHLLPPFEPEADLEIHLGRGAYVGLSRVENGRVNLCGLFRRDQPTRCRGEELILEILRGAGLNALATRITSADFDPDSVSTVAGLDFTRDFASDQILRLGDSRGMIPPFTGHGMAMAFESAACALPSLIAYARNECPWSTVQHEVEARHRRFARRLRIARSLHPFLYLEGWQTVMGNLARFRLLPMTPLYQLTHS